MIIFFFSTSESAGWGLRHAIKTPATTGSTPLLAAAHCTTTYDNCYPPRREWTSVTTFEPTTGSTGTTTIDSFSQPETTCSHLLSNKRNQEFFTSRSRVLQNIDSLTTGEMITRLQSLAQHRRKRKVGAADAYSSIVCILDCMDTPKRWEFSKPFIQYTYPWQKSSKNIWVSFAPHHTTGGERENLKIPREFA